MLVYERVYYTTNTVGENTFPQFLLSFGMFWPKNIKQTVIAVPVFKKKTTTPNSIIPKDFPRMLTVTRCGLAHLGALS